MHWLACLKPARFIARHAGMRLSRHADVAHKRDQFYSGSWLSVSSSFAKQNLTTFCARGADENTDTGMAATPISLVSHSQKATSSLSLTAP